MTDTVHTTSTSMDAETLEALKGSIAKWEGVVAGTTRDLGAFNCPLCKMFARKPECRGCPVAERTGKSSCYGTPYYRVIEGNKVTEQAELDFLRSLLPTDDIPDETNLTGDQ